MLISCNKLKSHIKNSEDIDWTGVWDKFTIRTAEVEGIKKVGNSFDGVVVAEIKECVDHPDSDHLHVLMVDDGSDELVQVVCGAPNVRVGLKTAFVRVGGHIDGVEITKRPLRGVESNGMCCSVRELSIGESHDGIIELPEDAPVGMDLKEYLPIEDIIVEIDNKSLTNRPDLWGHYGIAREICAITNHELKELDTMDIEGNGEDLDIKILDPDLCYRYTGLRIENINNNKAPLDMQIFLYYVGMRSISLLVDLTNYLMLELGQPMHAFDARVVKSIEVGRAKDGDTYTTLDGVKRELSNDTLMIKNDNKYFAIAGVMGGLDSEILSDTTSVFLESATFNAGSIRKTAIGLGLRTESSARYEKSLDPNMTELAIKRLVYLLHKENPDLVIASNLTDVYPKVLESITINLSKELLATYIGVVLPDQEVCNILDKLGFSVTTNKESYDVVVPTYRHSKDINIEEDLIEEIARIYGLEKIESKPLKLDLTIKTHEDLFEQSYELKEMLAVKYDMHEVNSYIWYDTKMLQELGIEKSGVKLLGKSENNILRDELSLSLMNIVNENFKNFSSFNIFEIGTIIKNNENKRMLSIILADKDSNTECVYNKAKNICTYIFRVLKNVDIDIVGNDNVLPYYDKLLGKCILINGEEYGTINVLEKTITNKISKKKVIVCIDIDFDKYSTIIKEVKAEKLISKYPSVELDYTIILNDSKYEILDKVLKEFKSNLIDNYKLVSIYENKYTIKYTLSSNNKTLDNNDLQKFRERFVNHLKSNNLSIVE